MLTMTSCNPLRRMQRTEKTDSSTVDKSIISKSDNKILSGETNFVQTVIEFHHPIHVAKPETPEEHTAEQKEFIDGLLTEATTYNHPPIKRIIRTEVSSNTEISETSDSLVNRDFQNGVISEISEKVVEKPPSSVIAIRWIVIGIGCLLALFLVIKIRFFK